MDSERLWLCVELNPPVENLSVKLKSLADICVEKLISDACLLGDIARIPRTIFCRLLLTAIDQNRTLSIAKLMKYSPVKEIELPVPLVLKCWRSLIEKTTQSVDANLQKFYHNARTVLDTFLNLVNDNCPTSQLQSVDLSIFPWDIKMLHTLYQFLTKRLRNRILYPRTYTVKSAFTLAKAEDPNLLISSLETAELTGFRLLVNGLTFTNDVFDENDLLILLDKSNPSEFSHFTLDFAGVRPSIESPLKKLWSFKNLKHFSCSYTNYDFTRKASLLETFGKTLAELPNITHLLLRGNILSGCMDTLLQHSCKKKETNSKKLRTEHMDCCIVHNRRLEYLDISACHLRNEDILFLREFQPATCLKYLNVGCNKFKGRSAFETLLTLNTSLIMLDIENCVKMEYDPDLFPCGTFKKLKFLNMKGLKLSSRSERLLNVELEKIPDALVIRNVETIREEFQELDNILLVISRNLR